MGQETTELRREVERDLSHMDAVANELGQRLETLQSPLVWVRAHPQIVLWSIAALGVGIAAVAWPRRRWR